MSDIIIDNQNNKYKTDSDKKSEKTNKQESRCCLLTFLLFILTEIYFTLKFSYGILLEFGGNLNIILIVLQKNHKAVIKRKKIC